MGTEFERFYKAIEFERKRSSLSTPLAKRLQALLGEERPFFASKNGTKYPVDRRDLEKVVAILGEETEDLSLPIYLNPAPDLGRGFYRLLGVESGSEMAKKHSKILFAALGVGPRNYLYSYEVQRLKREMPTLIYILY